MKTQNFVNPITQEKWVCEDVTKTKQIDGVTYLQVHKPDNQYRKMLMRKDSLQKVVKFK